MMPALALASTNFDRSVDIANRNVNNYFQCDKIKDNVHSLTALSSVCQTKIDIGKGGGLYKLNISIQYKPNPLEHQVRQYRFLMPQGSNLIRENSYRGLIGFATFFGKDVAAALNTKENYELYLQGQDLFKVKGLEFVIRDVSNFTVDVFDSSDTDTKHPFSPGFYLINSKKCKKINGVSGWEVRWSDQDSQLQPAFKRTPSSKDMLQGYFYIKGDKVVPNFRPNGFGTYKDSYLNIFVDQVLVYQQKRPHSRAALPSMSLEALYKMMPGKIGVMTLSRDLAGEYITDAVSFSLGNLAKALDMAVEGKQQAIASKSLGFCD